MSDPEVFFCLNPVCKLHWVCWGDECVVFDETSGQTHCMGLGQSLVLDFLGEHPWQFDGLFQTLTAMPEFAGDSNLRSSLETILNELQATGLVDATVP